MIEMIKRKIALAFAIGVLLLLAVSFSYAVPAVTRTISPWNCPIESGKFPVTVNLAATGISSSYTIDEILPIEWQFQYSGSYFSSDLFNGYRRYSIPRSPSQLTTTYTVGIPESYGASGSITGEFADLVNTYVVGGATAVTIRPRTCSGALEDADTDNYGMGCGCLGNDCDDTNTAAHPGATEIMGNTVDEDCSGTMCNPDINNPYYYRITSYPCTSLSDTEKNSFLTAWVQGLSNPASLSSIISNIPAGGFIYG